MTAAAPSELFARLFTGLEAAGLPAVILHSYQEYPERVASDIDYALCDSDLGAGLRLVAETAEAAGWVLAQRLQHEPWSFYQVLINPNQPEQCLKLDLCSHYAARGRVLLRDETLLAGRRQRALFHTPAPAVEFVYLLIKAIVKNKPAATVTPRLRELAALDPRGAVEQFAAAFGAAAGPGERWLDDNADWSALANVLWRRHPPTWRERWAEGQRRWRRWRQPTGARLALLGPDGVGKSTLLAGLSADLEPVFRRQATIHFTPAVGRPRGGAPVAKPHGAPTRAVAVGWGKTLYYFLDQWLGFLLRQRAALARSTCVMFDRNFNDLLVDPRRYRLRGCATLVRALRPWTPAFDMTFILDAPAEVIHARKPELPVAEIERQQTRLRELAARDPGATLVWATEPASEVRRSVARDVLVFMAARLRAQPAPRADAGAPRAGGWESLLGDSPAAGHRRLRVIRRWGQPFLLLPLERVAAERALELYAAQTPRARVVRGLLAAGLRWGMTAPIPTAEIAWPPDHPLMKFIAAQGAVATCAILTGNPRLPGQRLIIAVFDVAGEPVAVIKAGRGEVAGQLIERERAFLRAAGARPGLPRWRTDFDHADARGFAVDYMAGNSPAVDPVRAGQILSGWVDRGCSVSLADCPAWRRLAGAASGSQLLRRLEARLGGRRFHPALFHGDFTPWNIKVHPHSGAWTALDWERGELTGPPAWDWLHFVIQTGILVDRAALDEMGRRVHALLEHAAFQAYCARAGIGDVARPWAVAYLLYCATVIRPTESLRATLALQHRLANQWLND